MIQHRISINALQGTHFSINEKRSKYFQLFHFSIFIQSIEAILLYKFYQK